MFIFRWFPPAFFILIVGVLGQTDAPATETTTAAPATTTAASTAGGRGGKGGGRGGGKGQGGGVQPPRPPAAQVKADEEYRAYEAEQRRQDALHAELVGAAAEENITRIDELLKQRANINHAPGQDAWSPLHKVVMAGGNASVVKALVARRADITQKDERGRTALWFSASYNFTELFDEIIQAAPAQDLEVTDRNGNKIYHMAYQSRNVKMFESLAMAGIKDEEYVKRRIRGGFGTAKLEKRFGVKRTKTTTTTTTTTKSTASTSTTTEVPTTETTSPIPEL